MPAIFKTYSTTHTAASQAIKHSSNEGSYHKATTII
jgi:hypothetical protein